MSVVTAAELELGVLRARDTDTRARRRAPTKGNLANPGMTDRHLIPACEDAMDSVAVGAEIARPSGGVADENEIDPVFVIPRQHPRCGHVEPGWREHPRDNSPASSAARVLLPIGIDSSMPYGSDSGRCPSR